MTVDFLSALLLGANIGYKQMVPPGWVEIQLLGKIESGVEGSLVS